MNIYYSLTNFLLFNIYYVFLLLMHLFSLLFIYSYDRTRLGSLPRREMQTVFLLLTAMGSSLA